MNYILLMILGVICASVLSVPVFAQNESSDIPLWIKVVASAWVDDKIDDLEYKNAISFLIESNIIKIKNPFIVYEISETERIYIEQADKDSKYITKLESRVNELEEKNESLSDKAVTDDVLLDLENMRIRANDYQQQLTDLQVEHDSLKAKLDNDKK